MITIIMIIAVNKANYSGWKLTVHEVASSEAILCWYIDIYALLINRNSNFTTARRCQFVAIKIKKFVDFLLMPPPYDVRFDLGEQSLQWSAITELEGA